MFLGELTYPLNNLKGAGPETCKHFAKLGIVSIADLLSRFPRDYEDRSALIPLREYFKHSKINTIVRVISVDFMGFGRMRTPKIHIEEVADLQNPLNSDFTTLSNPTTAVLVCFGRSFLEKKFIPGKIYRVCGSFFYKYGEIQSSSFDFEEYSADNTSFGQILPVYSLTDGLNQGAYRKLVAQALTSYAANISDELPPAIISRRDFPPLCDALSAIHFPEGNAALENAKKALIYRELFYLEILVAQRANLRKNLRGGGHGCPCIPLAPKQSLYAPPSAGAPRNAPLSPLQNRLLGRLPFKLTAGQMSAINDINLDMESPYPMARLLQGDVGSGKTLVAFLAALRAVELGGTAALMAPT
jgi:ATP-dependent DNA helicase RecG